jgi:hypothetical protein
MVNDAQKKGTYPYCPSVGAMPPDDIPFIVEGRKKFPAGRERPELKSEVNPQKHGIAGKLT